METIEATFKVVTPMFISGADQNKAELRLPSIKGTLRFWWRALAWGRLGGELKAIRKEEATLFGSTDTGQAAVLMKLSFLKPFEGFVDKQNAFDWKISDWQSYAGYGLVDKKKSPNRQYVKPGLEFCLALSAQRSESLLAIQGALITFGLLGNLGGRSRKGWGSINLIQIRGDSFNWQSPQQPDELRAQINNLISVQREGVPTYSAFSSQTRVVLGPLQPDVVKAHLYLAQHYKDIIQIVPGKTQREQFGLPRKDNQKRRASPLLLHVHQLPDGQGIPLAIFLPAIFLEGQETPDGDYQQIENFLENIVEEKVQ